MSEKYAKDGLVVLAVNAWSEDKEIIGKFVTDLNLKHRILLNGWPDVKDLYGVKSVPTLLWIDRGGVVVDVEHDFDPAKGPETLDAKTKALLSRAG